jgi:hypothetical protein
MPYAANYAGLKADIVQVSEDQSDDLLSNLDTIIGLGETALLRDLDLEIFQDTVPAGNLTALSRVFNRPAGLLKIRDIWLVVAGARKYIPKRTEGYCQMYGEDPTITEKPSYWSEANETTMTFVNTPDIAYPVYAYGLVRPAGLSASNPTTWLTKYAGDLLLYSCLIRAETYLVNPSKVQAWQALYTQDQLPKAKLELRGMARAEYQMSRQVSTPVTPL